jgi:hypothetical protein
MTDKEVQELRSYFKSFDAECAWEQENAITQYKECLITRRQFNDIVGNIKYNGYLWGVNRFAETHGVHPVKVPLYVRYDLL